MMFRHAHASLFAHSEAAQRVRGDILRQLLDRRRRLILARSELVNSGRVVLNLSLALAPAGEGHARSKKTIDSVIDDSPIQHTYRRLLPSKHEHEFAAYTKASGRVGQKYRATQSSLAHISLSQKALWLASSAACCTSLSIICGVFTLERCTSIFEARRY